MPRTSAPVEVPGIASVEARRRTGHLLLVDDSPINQELAQAVLKGAGHSVETVGDGESAVRAVQEGAFDLVLMDVQMPGMDGMTATRLIRNLPGSVARIPIVAMTANVLPEQVVAFRKAGMDDHIGKPFDRDRLHATIERWLRDAPASSGAMQPKSVLEFDPAYYGEVCRFLTAARLREIMRTLVQELDISFKGDPLDVDVRNRLRLRAHSLSSAAGMIGFMVFAVTCHALEAYDETKVESEGMARFSAVVAEVRIHADRAARMTERMLADLHDATGPRIVHAVG